MSKDNIASILGSPAEDRREIIEYDVPQTTPVLDAEGKPVLDAEGKPQVNEGVEGAFFDGRPIKSIGFICLRLAEMQAADQRAIGKGPMQVAHEMLCAALWTINGDRVTRGDGSADRALAEMGPQLYSLLAAEFTRLHTPTENQISSFRASRRRKVV